MKRRVLCALCLMLGASAIAETNVINGVTYVCEDGVCRMMDAPASQPADDTLQSAVRPRLAQGYMDAESFIAFLENRPPANAFAGKGIWLVLLLTLLGGLAMNLTPCVLPMIPINLMIIGRSAARGMWYGLGIMIAYGILGVLASVGGLAFGSVQSNPWFNLGVALVFVALAAALSGFFYLDFSKNRARWGSVPLRWAWGGAFLMGGLSAILAGACVAPILIAVLLLTAKLFAAGNTPALGLPFVLGLGMALPWPFVGAGLSVLPKPGAWMKWVNRAFALVVLCLAGYYGMLAGRGFASPKTAARTAQIADFPSVLEKARRPVLVDCWASWCKNCAAMEAGTLEDPNVRVKLKSFTVIRLQAEDINALRKLPGFEGVMGLPAFVVFE